MSRIDHTGTSEVVCPHCGHEHSDSWELHADDGVMDCAECQREFRFHRDVTVTYDTEPVAQKEGE